MGLMVAFTVLFGISNLIKQWSFALSIISYFMGVQTQLPEIRISLGGSALFAHMEPAL